MKCVKRFFTECIRRGKDIGKLDLSSKELVGWYNERDNLLLIKKAVSKIL